MNLIIKFIPIIFAVLALIGVRAMNKDIELIGILLAMGLSAGVGVIVKSIIYKEK